MNPSTAIQAVSGNLPATLPNGQAFGSTAALDTSPVNNAYNAIAQTRADQATSAVGAASAVGQNSNQLANMQYNLQAGKMQQLASLSNKIQALNPANYKQTASQDGGYNFYDGSGQPVTLSQYLQATGKDPAVVLKGSTNPTDQNYLDNHTILQKVNQYLLQGAAGQKALQDLDNKNFGGKLVNSLKNNGYWGTPGGTDQMNKDFMKYYSNVWGGGSLPQQSFYFRNPNTQEAGVPAQVSQLFGQQ